MNGSATLANGHDASTVVQLQDIQEQQDPIVIADEETASRPNRHTDAAESVPIPTTAVVPKAVDKGETVVKKFDWEIPRKTLHLSIGPCLPTVASACLCSYSC